VFAFSPEGKHIVVAGILSAEVFEVDPLKSVGKASTGFSHAFFPDEHRAVWTQRSYDFSTRREGKIIVWDVDNNKEAASYEIPDDRFSTALLARKTGEFWLFLSSNKFEIQRFDLATGKLKKTVKPELADSKQPYTSAGIWPAVASDGSVFASTNFKPRIYSGETGKIVATLPAQFSGLSGGLVPGGTRYLAGTGNPNKTDLTLLNWKTGKPLAVLTGFSAGQTTPEATVSADGKTAVAVSKEGEVLVFDLSSVK
jgi:WD40 repeat protein